MTEEKLKSIVRTVFHAILVIVAGLFITALAGVMFVGVAVLNKEIEIMRAKK